MTESGFWRKLRPKLPRGHYSRIENPTDPGTPDVSFCVGGIEGFLELKYRSTYPRRNHPVLPPSRGLRRQQVLWITRRARAGGRVGILVGVVNRIYLVPGHLASELHVMELGDYPRPLLTITPSAVSDWFLRKIRRL